MLTATCAKFVQLTIYALIPAPALVEQAYCNCNRHLCSGDPTSLHECQNKEKQDDLTPGQYGPTTSETIWHGTIEETDFTIASLQVQVSYLKEVKNAL